MLKLTKKGFTLVELLVVISIFGLIIGLIYGIFVSSKRVQSAEEQLVGLSQEARGGMQQMVRDLRMLGADTQFTALARIPAGLIIMNNTVIEFEGDVDLDNNIERIRYFWDQTGNINTLNRWELELTPGNDPGALISLSGAEPLLIMETVAYGISNLDFDYFSSAGTQTGVAADVRRVSISITARGDQQLQSGVAGFRTITVDVEVRNLGAEGAVDQPTPPAKPTNVAAVDMTVCGYMRVTWTRGTEGDLAGHKVYYKVFNIITNAWPDEWSAVKTVGVVSSTEFGGLTTGATYRVAVVAFDSSGYLSDISATSDTTLTDNVLPTSITNFTAIKNDVTSEITLNWTRGFDVDTDGRTADENGNLYFVKYDVFRGTSLAGPFNVMVGAGIANTTLSMTDIVPQKCTPYYYRASTTDACGMQSVSAVIGGPADPNNTQITESIVNAPQYFAPGGGTTIGTTAPLKFWSYARFSGTTADDPNLDTLMIRYFDGASCPASPVYAGNSLALPPGTAVPSGELNLDPANPITKNTGFTGAWPSSAIASGISKDKFYRFSAYSKNKCGYYSAPKEPDPSYCVSKCTDSTTYPGAVGLGDACIFNEYANGPIVAQVCDKIKLFWITKSGGLPPAACTAWGSGAANDFYPDEGDGGYLIHRKVKDIGFYQILAPDPVTGPIQPFYYVDNYRMGISGDCTTLDNVNCQYVTGEGRVCYRDRCSYQYAVAAVDCAMNKSGNPTTLTGTYREQVVLPYFSPGIINTTTDTTTWPVTLEGTKKNKVVFYVENTASANQSLKGGVFEWIDPAARLTKIEIANSVEAGGMTNYRTLWQSSANSTGAGILNPSTQRMEVADNQATGNSALDFTKATYIDWSGSSRNSNTFQAGTIAASPTLGTGDTEKAKLRLTFYTTGGAAQRMDDLVDLGALGIKPEQITVTPHYENLSTTHTFTDGTKICKTRTGDDAWTVPSFTITTTAGPSISSVKQSPPNQTGCDLGLASEGDCSIYSAPPSGNFRSYAYDWTSPNYYYFVDNNDVTLRAKIAPVDLPNYPVAQCGDTVANTGALIYYAITDNTIISPPQPQDDAGNEKFRTPTKTSIPGVIYQKVSMCRQDVAEPCSNLLGCPYAGTIPAQTGKRVWYYILATDSRGFFNISPVVGDTFTNTYNYDAKEKVFRYIWTSFSYVSATNRLTVPSLWITRIKGNTGSDPLDNSDHSTKGSTLTIVVTGNDLLGFPQAETIVNTSKATTDVPACSGCWQSETGLSASVSTVNTFQSPTVFQPMIVSITASKPLAGYPDKTCTWTITGPDVFTGGQCL